MTHTDVVQNSWSELFACAKQYQQKVQGSLPHLQVTYASIGSSQYERNHPDSSLDIGFTHNALHWLSKGVHLKHTMSPFSSRVSVFPSDTPQTNPALLYALWCLLSDQCPTTG